MDEPCRQRAIHDAIRFKFTFRCPALVDSGRVSLRRTLNQIWCAFSRACFYDVLSLRSHGATEDSSVSISDGRRGALLVLSAVVVDFRIYRIRLGASDRGCCIDTIDHLVLPVLPGRRRANINDRCRSRGVYTLFYITLRQQDYALFMGAIALFIVLAIVMYVTRKIDWYARDAS